VTAPAAPPELDELLVVVADALGRDPSELGPDVKVSTACRDSLDLYCLYVTLDEWVPGFLLPRQLDLDLATLADVHHYLVLRAEQRAARHPPV
jgi:hypothetical protein